MDPEVRTRELRRRRTVGRNVETSHRDRTVSTGGSPIGTGPSPDRRVPRRERWETRYVVAAIAVDVVAVVIAVSVGLHLELGTWVPWFGEVAPGIGVLSGLLFLASLTCARAWDPRVLGQDPDEYLRVVRATVATSVLLGMAGVAVEALAVRPWAFGLVPVAGVLAVLGRRLLRVPVHRVRRRGACSLPVLLVGTDDAARALIERTRRDNGRGWVIIGVCTPTGPEAPGAAIAGVPVVGDLDAVPTIAAQGRHRMVAVCPTPGFGPKRLHALSWRLDGTSTELVVDPGLMEVAGPRLHVQPVDGLPLLRLTRPRMGGLGWILKNVVDRAGAALLLLLLGPVFLAVAVAIKLDGGPVFFRQNRVGRHGREFGMLKFRSMVVDAEAVLATLVESNDGAGPLFKMRTDPRVTPVGRLLRRFSLDELPQLLNVLAGSMSLVGPRPPLPAEVETYGQDARRRLMVRPGLTGLWQISGRSDLSWEESVRLDLRYVENWTLVLDGLILLRTIGAVLRGRGAY